MSKLKTNSRYITQYIVNEIYRYSWGWMEMFGRWIEPDVCKYTGNNQK